LFKIFAKVQEKEVLEKFFVAYGIYQEKGGKYSLKLRC
jgi:hypothetical protein